ANEAGLALRAVSPMYAPGHGEPGLVLGLGGYADRQVQQAVERLGQVILACAGSGA
ncbi:DNA-binding protein, partial [Serratia marcescens]